MAYQSVDELQKVLTREVFHYAKAPKKAAGRALGTLVEIITFYTLKSWGFEHNIAIERKLPEFANEGITHNVEYSLHPSKQLAIVPFEKGVLPLTARKILKSDPLAKLSMPSDNIKSNSLLTKNSILRNSCLIGEIGKDFVNAYLEDYANDSGDYSVALLRQRPFAIFECKRVGVEEGMKKGPQSIEKAKQGAYVARMVSSLQKMRFSNGKMGGLIEKRNGDIETGDYYELMARVIASNDQELLSQFVLTIGVVSNHGNWFTSESHNKELKVLAQSYDWLIFLTDRGLSQFIDQLLFNPTPKLQSAKNAFLASYTGKKGKNEFTKVNIALEADTALQSYFRDNMEMIEGWFNVIAPAKKPLAVLKSELEVLKAKNWGEIHG